MEMIKQKLRHIDRRTLIRPTVYTAFTRFVMALTGALLWQQFLSPTRNIKPFLFLFLGVFFAALSWIAYLRLDGIRLPKAMMKRVNLSKKPKRGGGDIIDYVDEHPPITFDDLDDDEKDVVCLVADALCAILYVILSFIPFA